MLENMTSSQSDKPEKPVSDSEELVDKFLDAIWTERGLSANTLGAYRADLMTLSRGLSEKNIAIEAAEKADLLEFIAHRVESGAKPRSTARQLSSFRRFFRYIMREGLRDTDPTADIEMPRIGRSLPKTLTEDEVDAKKAWLRGHLAGYVPEEKAARNASLYDSMSGTPDQIVSRLEKWDSEGMSYAIVHFPDAAYDISSVELFATEVMPHFG